MSGYDTLLSGIHSNGTSIAGDWYSIYRDKKMLMRLRQENGDFASESPSQFLSDLLRALTEFHTCILTP